MGSRDATRLLRRGLFSALLCLPLLFGFAASAQAQVLFSKIGQADGTVETFEHDYAQIVAPGPNPGGYRLESVDIEFASATRSSAFDSTVLAVEIRHFVDNDTPGALVGRLTNPTGTSFSADRLMRFTAPTGGISLDSGAAYFLVLDVAGQRDADFAKIRTTASSQEDPGAPGFTTINSGRPPATRAAPPTGKTLTARP